MAVERYNSPIGDNVEGATEEIEQVRVFVDKLHIFFWYEFSLTEGPMWYGFDIPKWTVTFIDDGKTRINTSTYQQCAASMTALLSLNELPGDENDARATLSTWRNKPVRISSFLVAETEMLATIQRATKTQPGDWSILSGTHSKRYQRASELSKGGPVFGYRMDVYTHNIFFLTAVVIISCHGLAYDALDLPKEDLDEATKGALGSL